MSNDIDFAELNENKDNLVVIDVRNPDEVETHGHIPGAKNLPLGELEDALQLGDEEFKEKYGFEKPSEGTTVVTHCMKGGRAKKAGDLMAGAGWAIRVYVGSFTDWKANGGEVASGKP